MTTQTATLDEQAPVAAAALLRRALYFNVAFSTLSGAGLILLASPLGELLGTVSPFVLRGIGGGLLLFAGSVWLNARREVPRIGDAWSTIGGDLAWVAGSAALLAYGPAWLSRTGSLVVLDVALVVLAIAIFQILGVRRLRAGAATV